MREVTTTADWQVAEWIKLSGVACSAFQHRHVLGQLTKHAQRNEYVVLGGLGQRLVDELAVQRLL